MHTTKIKTYMYKKGLLLSLWHTFQSMHFDVVIHSYSYVCVWYCESILFENEIRMNVTTCYTLCRVLTLVCYLNEKLIPFYFCMLHTDFFSTVCCLSLLLWAVVVFVISGIMRWIIADCMDWKCVYNTLYVQIERIFIRTRAHYNNNRI